MTQKLNDAEKVKENAAKVRNAKVRNAKVRNAKVRNAKVRNARAQNAKVRNARAQRKRLLNEERSAKRKVWFMIQKQNDAEKVKENVEKVQNAKVQRVGKSM
jgi:hypothetical protein